MTRLIPCPPFGGSLDFASACGHSAREANLRNRKTGRRSSRPWVSSGLFLVILCMPPASGLTWGVDMMDALGASVAVDKSVLSLGDQLNITGILKNNSNERIFIYTKPFVYPTIHIRMRSRDGHPLKSFIQVEIEPRKDTRADLVEMKPGEEVMMSFSAVLRIKTIPDAEKGGDTHISGAFLDFGKSAILIPAGGGYDLRFDFEVFKEFSEYAEKKYGLQNVWYGRITSQPVRINMRL